MEKFSKLSKFKINSQEREVINESSNIKYSISRLIEEFLNIRIEGPIDPILMGTIFIEGKDEFINALIELFKQRDIKEQIKLLENVKYNGLSTTIDNLNDRLNEAQTPSEKAKHIKRIKDLMGRIDGDINKAKEEAERQANTIKTGEKAYYRSVAAENLIGDDDMSKKILNEIAKIFLFRSQQLGYRK